MDWKKANEIYEGFAETIVEEAEHSWRESAWHDVRKNEEGASFTLPDKGLVVRLARFCQNGNERVILQYWFTNNPDRKVHVTSLEQLLQLV